jgi:hypothetical protein
VGVSFWFQMIKVLNDLALTFLSSCFFWVGLLRRDLLIGAGAKIVLVWVPKFFTPQMQTIVMIICQKYFPLRYGYV